MVNTKTITISAEDELPQLAQEILELSKSTHNNLIALIGNLGAGKTTLTQQVAKHLGVEKTVQSPTFVLMNEYTLDPSKSTSYKTLIHIDAYRIEQLSEADILDLGNLAKDSSNLIVVEWADNIQPLLPKHHVEVKIKTDGDKREFQIKQT